MEPQFDLKRYIAIFRRRWAYMVIPALLIAAAGATYAFLSPPQYEATATILVESQQIPTDLASPTVTSEAAERVRMIEQRLLTRDNLLEIAGKFSLYQYLGPEQSPTTIVDNARRAIRIAQIDTVGSRGASRVVGFTVRFQYRDPAIAARVTNELVNSILSQNVETRLTRASETSDFFSQQKSSLEQRLLALESSIAQFKRDNEADMPETLEVRRAQLTELRLQLGTLMQKIRLAKESAGTPGASDDASVRQLSFTLQAKQLELKSMIEERDELTPLAEKGYVATNRMRDLDRGIAVAELGIQSIEAQIVDRGGLTTDSEALRLLDEQKAELDAQAEALSASILKTPSVQVQLNTLNRDYENLLSEYRVAQKKVEDAALGERLEQDRQAERFEVIEQAVMPDQPTSPDRPKIALAGLAGGLGAGLAFLVLRQALDRSIYSAGDLERSLQLRPIATIPYIASPHEQRRRRRRLVIGALLLIVVLGAALFAVDYLYMPLDLLFMRIIERAQAWLSINRLFN